MDPRYSAEAEAYRQKIQAFLAEHLPASWEGVGALDPEARRQFVAEWRRTLADNQLLAVAWPKEYGGAGLSAIEQTIINEEFTRAGVPTGSPAAGRSTRTSPFDDELTPLVLHSRTAPVGSQSVPLDRLGQTGVCPLGTNAAPWPGITSDGRSARTRSRDTRNSSGLAPRGSAAGPCSFHHTWVHTTSPSAVSTSVEMSWSEWPGVASRRTDGDSGHPSGWSTTRRSVHTSSA